MFIFGRFLLAPETDQGYQGSTDPVGSIAELLTGEVETESNPPKDDSEVEKDDEDTTEVDDSSDDEEDEPLSEEQESEDEVDEEQEATWESALGVTDDQLAFDDKGNIKGVVVKVNGETATVSMPDLIAGYQTNKAVTQKFQALSEEQKKLETQSKQFESEYASKVDAINSMARFLEDQIVGEYNAIDWERLRKENPAEYAARRQDYSSKAMQIQEAMQAVEAEKGQLQTQAQRQSQEAYMAHLNSQREIMLRNNPSWNDHESYSKDMGELKSFLSSQYGFTEQDFASVADARLIELVKDARKFRAGAKAVEEKMRKKVPKFLKGGNSKPRRKVSKVESLTKAANRAKGPQKRSLQSEAVAQLLVGE